MQLYKDSLENIGGREAGGIVVTLLVVGCELADVAFQVGHGLQEPLGLTLQDLTNDMTGVGVVEDRPDDVRVKLAARLLVSFELPLDPPKLHFVIPAHLIVVTRLVVLDEDRHRKQTDRAGRKRDQVDDFHFVEVPAVEASGVAATGAVLVLELAKAEWADGQPVEKT